MPDREDIMNWYAIYGRTLKRHDRTNLQSDPRSTVSLEKVQPKSSAENKENEQSDKQRQETAEKEKEQECNS